MKMWVPKLKQTIQYTIAQKQNTYGVPEWLIQLNSQLLVSALVILSGFLDPASSGLSTQWEVCFPSPLTLSQLKHISLPLSNK